MVRSCSVKGREQRQLYCAVEAASPPQVSPVLATARAACHGSPSWVSLSLKVLLVVRIS